MESVAVFIALVLAVVSGAVAAFGGWLFATGHDARWFWPALRLAQALAIAEALVAGVAAVTGRSPSSNLYWLYALLPVAVSLIAEQFRLTSAQAVLDARGLPDAQAVGELDAEGQRGVVLAILHRELGVMTASAAVLCFLALRAAATAHGL